MRVVFDDVMLIASRLDDINEYKLREKIVQVFEFRTTLLVLSIKHYYY